MRRGPNDYRRLARIGLAPLALWVLCGCQTVRTDENDLARTNIPREGNKVSMPTYVVEPPDILIVEVLEALPGRPITGERLVRPDGTISLGFYGDVHVAGLTRDEIKTKIVIHMRKFVSDETLGLYAQDYTTKKLLQIEPIESDRVFVDVASYNSQVYYVLGDVNASGRFPHTGNETVLDALQYAGGLDPNASVNNIRVVRPAPPGSSREQVLPVNYAAITQAGDTTTNYQLLPGDRIFVYRDPIVRTTIFVNRLAAPFNTVLNTILTYSFAARNVKSINVPINGGNNSNNTNTTINRPIISNPAQ